MRYVSASNSDFSNLMANAKDYSVGDAIRNSGNSMSATFRHNYVYLPLTGYLSDEGRNSLRAWMNDQTYRAMIMFIYSYDTVVGALNVSTGDYWITDEKFSQTTGRHMNHIRRGLLCFATKNASW